MHAAASQRNRTCSAAAFALLSLLALPASAADGGQDPPLPAGGFAGSPLGARLSLMLAEDGFSEESFAPILADPRGAINRTTLAYAIVYRESKADYSRFLDPDRLERARSFLARKADALQSVEEKYGVPREVIAAILMVESDFGRFRKLHGTLNVFATLVWAGLPENFETVRAIVRGRLPDVEDEKIRERSRRKAAWGYEQLKVLLQIAEREGTDPFAIEGSWAGAFGLPQFIPTSYWSYAVDGNGDGRVDLYEEDDAIHSIGSYLRNFGWREGAASEKNRKALRRYNNSDLYVDTILAAADRLGG